MKVPQRIHDTIRAFGREVCLAAYKQHLKGDGGNSVGIDYANMHVNRHGDYTVIGDRLIDSGAWICEREGINIYERFCPEMRAHEDTWECITFTGSWGEITVYRPSGKVVAVTNDLGSRYTGIECISGGYHDIDRVDLDEFKRWLSKVGSVDGKGFQLNHRFSWDILHIGYWDIWGNFSPPVDEAREIYEEFVQENKVVTV